MTVGAAEAVRSSRVPPAVRALRPRHWIKNAFVLAPLVFAERLLDPTDLARALGAFGVFCLIASAVYVMNDIVDREADRLHPRKRLRPIASGAMSPATGAVLAAVCAAAGMAWAWGLGGPFAVVAGLYLAQNLLYSFMLKSVVILDVMMVAAGFILRAWGGAVVLGVDLSRWLILCTGLLALFLGFVKRRQEIQATTGSGGGRAILREYSAPYLDQMISIVTAATVVAYCLYAFDPEVAAKLGTRHLGLTVPFVLFGIFRYLYLVHQRGQGENPTALLYADRPLQLNLLLWIAAVLIALYLWP